MSFPFTHWHIALLLFCLVNSTQSQEFYTQIASEEILLSEILADPASKTLWAGEFFSGEGFVFTIQIENDTDRAFDLVNVETDCDCTSVDLSGESCSPGTALSLPLQFNMPCESGHQSRTVVCELAFSEDDPPVFAVFAIEMELRHDFWIRDPWFTLIYGNSDLSRDDLLVTLPSKVVISEDDFSEMEITTQIAPESDLPNGVYFLHEGTASSLAEPIFRFGVDPLQIPSLPREIEIPLIVQLMGPDNHPIAEGVRTAGLRMRNEAQLVTNPSSPFLGILVEEDCPKIYRMSVSLDPPLMFRPLEICDELDSLSWCADPNKNGEEIDSSWTISFTLSEIDTPGGHTLRIPFPVMIHDEVGQWEHDLTLEIQYIAVNR